MDVRGWVRALRKNWWIVLVTTAVALGIGVLVTVLTPKQYASSVTFFVRTPTEQITGAYQADQFAQKRVNSYVQLLDSQSLADLVLQETRLPMTTGQVQSAISAKGDLNTVLLTASVTAGSPETAFQIADSVSRQLVDLVASIETSPGSLAPAVNLVVTSAPTLNPAAVRPEPFVNLGLALIAGLLAGVGIAALREILDTSVRSVDTVKATSGGAVLGVVPFDGTAKASPLLTDDRSHSIRAEAFRQLRTNLQFVDVENPVKVLVVTSSVAEEGKSNTAANLALTFAEAGQRVLLIEADLRRPRVADYLGIEGAVGLTNVLAGQVSIDEVLQPWGRASLTVLPSGSIPPNPSELLGGRRMHEVLDHMKQRFDVIVIDTPPLLPVTDGAIAAAAADGAILVVRHGRTRRAQVEAAVAALTAVDARLLGSILNMVPAKGVDSYAHYGYGYYVADSEHSARGFLQVSKDDPSAWVPAVERDVPAGTAGGRHMTLEPEHTR